MNPSPDRGKECLPPKKRESRQGSTEHHVPLGEFKPPVPLRSRSITGGGEGGREASDRDRALINPNPHLLHTPPPLPAPAPALPLPLPWHLSYSPSVSLPLFPGQVGERRSSGSPAWRDDPLPSPLHHHSRWLRGEGTLSLPPSPSSSSASSFKTPFPADSREMWSYINSGRRDNSSSLFSPPYLFSQHSLYPQDPSLVEARHRYLGKRPNGLDGPGSRTASTSRPLLTGEYGNDSSRTRLDVSPHSSHTNGGRRQQEDLTSRIHSGGPFLSDSHAQEGPEPHSSLQDRHPHGLVKTSSNLLSTSPHPLGLVPRAAMTGHKETEKETETETKKETEKKSHRGTGSEVKTRTKRSTYNMTKTKKETVSARDDGTEKETEGESYLLPIFTPRPQPVHSHSSPPALLPHFTKGSLIELASGRLKRVEELRTEDFLRSADTSPEFHLSTCTVLQISPSSAQGFSHLQVHLTDLNTQELLKVLVEYPFFVQDRGWSSCSPQKTSQLYGLSCRQLMEGDVCLALTPTPTQTHRTHTRTGSRTHRTHCLLQGSGRVQQLKQGRDATTTSSSPSSTPPPTSNTTGPSTHSGCRASRSGAATSAQTTLVCPRHPSFDWN
ncbi:Ataxin-1 Spinocerebellar ataxia type 1 protein [Larimichthys crocea]|uniref:Ataxin-1 Spinocerebellar ataxia type 1 protein n=1 Tax=Larimichthys crocea TaxID=215358 RepID=A0A6G0IQW0_LARCR|nr:Ataxin-1 Spinocerebellar ataxia type 1 protein [Larimichthys crocea]